MTRMFIAGGILAVCCATVAQAEAKSCPPGQILRVSSGVCQPKSASNIGLLKGGNGKRKPAAVAKPAAAAPDPSETASADGEAESTPKAAAPGAAARPKRPPAQKSAGAPSVEPSRVRSTKSSAQAVVTPKSAAPEASASRAVQQPDQDRAAPLPPTPKAAGAQTASAPPAMPAVDARPPLRSTAPPAADEIARAPSPSTQSDAGLSGGEPAARRRAPDAPLSSDQVASIPRSNPHDNPAKTVSKLEATAGGAIAEARLGLPQWGDETVFANALRANWTTAPMTETFRRGSKVSPDVPLQRVPEPFASYNSTGVDMHYLVANGDVVLVLPLMRVVVDVYPGSAAAREH